MNPSVDQRWLDVLHGGSCDPKFVMIGAVRLSVTKRCVASCEWNFLLVLDSVGAIILFATLAGERRKDVVHYVRPRIDFPTPYGWLCGQKDRSIMTRTAGCGFGSKMLLDARMWPAIWVHAGWLLVFLHFPKPTLVGSRPTN